MWCGILVPTGIPHRQHVLHHLQAGLNLTTSLHQTSIRTDITILTPKCLVIIRVNIYLYYFILTEIIILILLE